MAATTATATPPNQPNQPLYWLEVALSCMEHRHTSQGMPQVRTSKARLLSVPPWPIKPNHCSNKAASLYFQPDGGRTRVLANGHTALPLPLNTPPSARAAVRPPPPHTIVDIVGCITQCRGRGCAAPCRKLGGGIATESPT